MARSKIPRTAKIIAIPNNTTHKASSIPSLPYLMEFG